MNRKLLKEVAFYLRLVVLYALAILFIPKWVGQNGFFGDFFVHHTALKMTLYTVLMAHLTIVCMSLCFHRSHTHQAVKFNRVLDLMMQVQLWCVTSMSKLDWVSVHVYHHANSDTVKDPHSPAHKGLAHVFFMGAFDYTKAKSWPEVLKIRARIPATKFERFIADHTFLAPGIFTFVLMFLFGPVYGSILMLLNFIISPLFAVGGVNALAHAFGYQNYDAKDESRNLGFLFPLNWIISGELDHNNHHKFPKSPSFSHRWFEFDIGWVYITVLKQLGLAKVTGTVPKYAKASVPSNSESEVAFVS